MSLTKEQLEQRKGLITATDAAAICGVSPYSTAHDIYAQKLGLVPPLEQTFAMRRGHAMEALGVEWLQEQRAPLIVKRSGDVTRTHSILHWLGATPDALVYEAGREKPVAVAEIKTAGLRVAHLWDDEVGEPCLPDEYLVQGQVQMTVTGLKKVYVVGIIPTEDEPRIYEIEHEPELEAEILEACDKFRRNHLEPRVPPPYDGSEGGLRLIKNLFPRSKRDMLVATPETESIAQRWLAAREREAEAKAQAQDLEAALCEKTGEHEGIRGDGWRLLWRFQETAEVKAYTRKAHRVFDLRRVGKSKRAA